MTFIKKWESEGVSCGVGRDWLQLICYQHKFSLLPSYFTWSFWIISFFRVCRPYMLAICCTHSQVFFVANSFPESLTLYLDMLFFLWLFVVISYLLMALQPRFCGLVCFYSMYCNLSEVSEELRKRYLCLKWQKHSLFYFEMCFNYLRKYLIERYFYIETTKPTVIWRVMTNLKGNIV